MHVIRFLAVFFTKHIDGYSEAIGILKTDLNLISSLLGIDFR